MRYNVIGRVFAVWTTVLCLICAASVAGFAQQKSSEKEDRVWTEDLDRKLEMTIQALNVIREDLQEEQAAGGGKPRAEKKRADVLRENIGKISRLWRKLRKVVGPKGEQAEIGLKEETRLTRELSDKLGETIETMTVMKKELDRIRQDRQE